VKISRGFSAEQMNTPSVRASGAIESETKRVGDLRADLSETKNLAAQNPAKVTELNALITGFLKDTAAVVPPRNPDYNPAGKSRAVPADKAKVKAKATKEKTDPILD
jgi:hypothetical protein